RKPTDTPHPADHGKNARRLTFHGDSLNNLPAARVLSGTQHLGLYTELHYLEPERIPAARARIIRRLAITVLDARDPMGNAPRRTNSLALDARKAYLRQVRLTTRALEEAHRLDASGVGAAILVEIER